MSPSEYIHKLHNVSVLLYHFVCPAKYRRVVFSKVVDMTLKDVCLEIEKRYVRDQGLEKDYTVLHKTKQLAMFSDTT